MINLIEDAGKRGHAKWFVLYILEPSMGPLVTEADKSMWYGYKTGIGYEPPTDEMLANFYEQMAEGASKESSNADAADPAEDETDDEDGEEKEGGDGS